MREVEKSNRIKIFLVCVLFMSLLLISFACSVTTYKVTFYPNNGENSQTFYIKDGGTVDKPTFTKTIDGEALILEGWYLNENLTGAKYDFDTPVKSDLSLYAKWESSADNDDEEERLRLLAEAKSAKVSQLPNLSSYNELDYTTASWQQLSSAINFDIETINSLLTIEEVTAYSITASVNVLITKLSIANNFKSEFNNVLMLDEQSVEISDKSAVYLALSGYNNLISEIKPLLVNEKALIDALISKITALEVLKINSAIDESIKNIKVIDSRVAADTVPVSEFKPTEVAEILNEMNFSSEDIASIEETFETFTNLDDTAKNQIENVNTLVQASSQIDYFKILKYVDSALNPISLVASDYNPDIAFNTELLNYLIDFIAKYEAHQIYIQEFYNQMKDYSITVEAKLKGLIALYDSQLFKDEKVTILALTPANVTLNDRANIENALADYEALSLEARQHLATQKAHIDSLLMRIQMLQEAEEQASANIIINAIANLSGELQLSDRARVESVRVLYDSLIENVKQLVTNVDVLISAEQAIAVLVNEAQQTEQAAVLFAQDNATILSLTASTITLGDKSALETAVLAYTQLNDSAKALLTLEKKILDRLEAKIFDLENAESANIFKATYAVILNTRLSEITVALIGKVDLTEYRASLVTALQELDELDGAIKAYLTQERVHINAILAKIDAIMSAETESQTFLSNHNYAITLDILDVEIEDKELINLAISDYNNLSDFAKQILVLNIQHLQNLILQIGIMEGDEVSELILDIWQLESIDWQSENIVEILETEGLLEAIGEYWQRYSDLSSDNQKLVTNFQTLLTARLMKQLYNNCYLPITDIMTKGYEFNDLDDLSLQQILTDHDTILSAWTDLDRSIKQITDYYTQYISVNEDIAYQLEGLSENLEPLIKENIAVLEYFITYYDIVKDIPIDGSLDADNYLTHRTSFYVLYSDLLESFLDVRETELKQYALTLLDNESGDLYSAIMAILQFDLLADNNVAKVLYMQAELIFSAISGYFDDFENKYTESRAEYNKLNSAEKEEFNKYFPYLDEYLTLAYTIYSYLEDENDIANILLSNLSDFIYEFSYGNSSSTKELKKLGDKIMSDYQKLDETRLLIVEYSGYWQQFLHYYETISSFTEDMHKFFEMVIGFKDITPDKQNKAREVVVLAQSIGEENVQKALSFNRDLQEIYKNIQELAKFNYDGLTEQQRTAYERLLYWFDNISIENFNSAKKELNEISITLGKESYLQYLIQTLNNLIYQCEVYHRISYYLDQIENVATWDFTEGYILSNIFSDLNNLRYSSGLDNAEKFLGLEKFNKLNALTDRAVSHYETKITEFKSIFDNLGSGERPQANTISDLINMNSHIGSMSSVLSNELYKNYFTMLEMVSIFAIEDIVQLEQIENPDEIVTFLANWYSVYATSDDYLWQIISKLYYFNENKEKDDKQVTEEKNSEAWNLFVSKLNVASNYILEQNEPDFESVQILSKLLDYSRNYDSSLNDISYKFNDLLNNLRPLYPDTSWDSETKELFIMIRDIDIENSEIGQLNSIIDAVESLNNMNEFLNHSYIVKNNFALIKDYIEYLEFMDNVGESDIEYQLGLAEIYVLINALFDKNDSISISNVIDYGNDLLEINAKINVFNEKYHDYGFNNNASLFIKNKYDSVNQLYNKYYNYLSALNFVNEYYVVDWVFEESSSLKNSIGYYYTLEGLEQEIGSDAFNKLEQMYQTVQNHYSIMISDIKTRYEEGSLSKEDAYNNLNAISYYATIYKAEGYQDLLNRLDMESLNDEFLALLNDYSNDNVINFIDAYYRYNIDLFSQYFPATMDRFNNEVPSTLMQIYNQSIEAGINADMSNLYYAIALGNILLNRNQDQFFADKFFEAQTLYENNLSNFIQSAINEILGWENISDQQLIDTILLWYSDYSIVANYDFIWQIYNVNYHAYNIYVAKLSESADYLFYLDILAQMEDIQTIRFLIECVVGFNGENQHLWEKIYKLQDLYWQIEKHSGDPNWTDEVKAIYARLRDFGDVSYSKRGNALSLYDDICSLEYYLREEMRNRQTKTYNAIFSLADFFTNNPDSNNPDVISFFEKIDAIILQIDFNNASTFAEEFIFLNSIFNQYYCDYVYYRYHSAYNLYDGFMGCAYLKNIIDSIDEGSWNAVQQHTINEQQFCEIGYYVNHYGYVLQVEFPLVYEKALRIYNMNAEYLEDMIRVISHSYYSNYYTLKDASEFVIKYYELVTNYNINNSNDYYAVRNDVYADFMNHLEVEINAWLVISDDATLLNQILSWYAEYSLVIDDWYFRDTLYDCYYQLYDTYILRLAVVADYLIDLDTSAEVAHVKIVADLIANAIARDFYNQTIRDKENALRNLHNALTSN